MDRTADHSSRPDAERRAHPRSRERSRLKRGRRDTRPFEACDQRGRTGACCVPGEWRHWPHELEEQATQSGGCARLRPCEDIQRAVGAAGAPGNLERTARNRGTRPGVLTCVGHCVAGRQRLIRQGWGADAESLLLSLGVVGRGGVPGVPCSPAARAPSRREGGALAVPALSAPPCLPVTGPESVRGEPRGHGNPDLAAGGVSRAARPVCDVRLRLSELEDLLLDLPRSREVGGLEVLL